MEKNESCVINRLSITEGEEKQTNQWKHLKKVTLTYWWTSSIIALSKNENEGFLIDQSRRNAAEMIVFVCRCFARAGRCVWHSALVCVCVSVVTPVLPDPWPFHVLIASLGTEGWRERLRRGVVRGEAFVFLLEALMSPQPELRWSKQAVFVTPAWKRTLMTGFVFATQEIKLNYDHLSRLCFIFMQQNIILSLKSRVCCCFI